MSLYDAILIDADDTLLDFESAEKNALGALLKELGIDGPEAWRAYHQCNGACWEAVERGEMSPGRLRVKRFEDFLKAVRRPGDPAVVSERYLSLLAGQGMLLPGALEAVQAIGAVRPIAIVTNGIASVQHGRIDHSPLAPYVKAHIISEEIGTSKPNPRMIHEALRALGGIAPCRALMVGDSLKSDMACARNAGVDACWFNPKGENRPKDVPVRYEIRGISELPAIALR